MKLNLVPPKPQRRQKQGISLNIRRFPEDLKILLENYAGKSQTGIRTTVIVALRQYLETKYRKPDAVPVVSAEVISNRIDADYTQ